jgi:hypothetical protein
VYTSVLPNVPVTVGLTSGGSLSARKPTGQPTASPAPFVAAQGSVTPGGFSTPSTLPHALLLAMPVSGSLWFPLSNTVLLQHPFAPATPPPW